MATIHNPILPGFHPDPSVIRVGSDYYLVTSSFEYFPGVPIFHSTDLVNWRQIGHVLTRKSQLNLEGCEGYCGIYAPTLRYHAGTFYMITTNVRHGGNFFVTAVDPAGPWSEPVWVDEPMFDPSLLFDNGKVYYTRRGDGFHGIQQAEIDIATGRLLHPLRYVVEKFISPDIEGPHLYAINGLYYLMAAEGGTRFGHAEVIGRSTSPWGQFEPCPHNPILTHRDQGHLPQRDMGHAELVNDVHGNWWLFCLGTRQTRYDAATLLGRETFLAPVKWVDGWPVVGAIRSGIIEESFDSSLLPEQQPYPNFGRDDFDSPALGYDWNFLRNPNDADWSLTERSGHLRLRGSAVSMQEADSPAFIGRRQEHFSFQAACRVAFDPQCPNEEAGLTVFMTRLFHYDLAISLRSGQRCAVLKKQVGDIAVEQVSTPLPPGPLTLGVTSDGRQYSFFYQPEASPQQPFDSGLARLISAELASTTHEGSIFTGMYLAMYASGNGSPNHQPADFDWFEYQGVL
jgi:xylan 1,4-beta-xylosidase